MKEPVHSSFEVAINAVAVVGILLIMAGLIWLMYFYTQPAPVDEARRVERQRNLAEVNAQNKEQLDNYAWIDQGRGIVRLPVARAMELTIQEWQIPAVGRSNLLDLLEKAAPPAPAMQPIRAPADSKSK
jgi:hypothetical protein